jgi:hypothetical protein
MTHHESLVAFRGWACDLESKLNLLGWAREKGEGPHAFRALGQDRWKGFLQGLQEQGTSESALRGDVRDREGQAAEEARGSWVIRTGDLPGWVLVEKLAELMERGEEGAETAAAFLVSKVSGLLERPVREQLVVLGEMSMQGLLPKVENFTERLQLALESGAKQVLVPSENKRDLHECPMTSSINSR